MIRVWRHAFDQPILPHTIGEIGERRILDRDGGIANGFLQARDIRAQIKQIGRGQLHVDRLNHRIEFDLDFAAFDLRALRRR